MASDRVELGRVAGIHGLQGWLKVISYTSPKEAIFDYPDLWVGDRKLTKYKGKPHGRGLMMLISGMDNRTAVEPLVEQTIWIPREQLPKADAGEYYWCDLIGLSVQNTEGFIFGRIDRMLETGANDVMVVKGEQEYLIPFITPDVVESVDLEQGKAVVNWQPDYL